MLRAGAFDERYRGPEFLPRLVLQGGQQKIPEAKRVRGLPDNLSSHGLCFSILLSSRTRRQFCKLGSSVTCPPDFIPIASVDSPGFCRMIIAFPPQRTKDKSVVLDAGWLASGWEGGLPIEYERNLAHDYFLVFLFPVLMPSCD